VIGSTDFQRWRRFGRDVRPVEVTAPPRFARRELLVEHVEKHPILGRKERWHRIVADELLSAARDEFASEGWGPCCDRLADEYEGLVAAIVVERCREGVLHAHQLTVRDPSAENPREAGLEETVYAWDLDTRILVIATRSVRSAGPTLVENVAGGPVSPVPTTPYRLRTGYRFHADRTESGFRKEILRKLRDLETFSLERCPLWMVEHDGPDATIADRSPTETPDER
jgi:hypothetical protein